jgi:hypothetical protein
MKNKAIIQKNQYQAVDESFQPDFKEGDEYTIKEILAQLRDKC